MSLREAIAGREMQIAFPEHLAAEIMPLLIAERAELEAVFGAPVRFPTAPPVHGPRWIVVENPDLVANNLRFDAATTTLTSEVRDAHGLAATLQLLHSLVTLQVNELNDAHADILPDAATRIATEAERGFPGFAIRGLAWPEIRAQFPAHDEITLHDIERMIACLQDAHTSVRAQVPVYNPPYAVELTTERAVLRRVPLWSAAATAGVDAGWQVEIEDREGWLARTGAPPHAHALVAGRRAIALNGIEERTFTAISPEGERRTWVEHAEPFSLGHLVDHGVVANDIVYVRLHNWIAGIGIEQRFDEIITAHAHRRTMVLDLRGNTGGNLRMAQTTRRRFLRERTLLGTIQFTSGDGTLADPVELWDDPAPTGRWPGDLVVLTDALTYSASEDFLHGLQGLPHVTVIGQPSGGGSGRPRTLPLIPGWIVTMSTALTFTRDGHCIEGQGIPVDIACDPFTEQWRAHLGLPAS